MAADLFVNLVGESSNSVFSSSSLSETRNGHFPLPLADICGCPEVEKEEVCGDGLSTTISSLTHLSSIGKGCICLIAVEDGELEEE